MQGLYECLFVLAYLVYAPKAWLRKRLPHSGWSMRLGRYPAALRAQLDGKRSVWLHAVSVGEVLSARPLIAALAQTFPDPQVVSSITPGGFELAARQTGKGGCAVYWPFDLRGPVRRAFECFNPRILILMESELWPTVIGEAHKRRVPVAVVNGRVSERAFKRYLRVRGLMREMMGRVSLYLMQTEEDARRVRELGAPPERVRVVGSLKWDASFGSLPSEAEISEARERLSISGREPVIVAGSTHRGEEQPLLDAFRALRARHPKLRLILAPRHLERMGEVRALVERAGLSVALGSAGISGQWDVLIVDVFGKLPVFYALANAAFIGGSLIPHGGQNPLEAASSGKPAVFGPSMHNFQEIADALVAAGGCRRISGAESLEAALGELLDHPAAAERMGADARALTERSRGATRRILELLQPLLQ